MNPELKTYDYLNKVSNDIPNRFIYAARVSRAAMPNNG
jgi:hypothetical protein